MRLNRPARSSHCGETLQTGGDELGQTATIVGFGQPAIGLTGAILPAGDNVPETI